MKLYILVLMLLATTVCFAKDNFDGKLAKVDDDTVSITIQVSQTFDISELKAKRDYFIAEQAQANASFDDRISKLNEQINAAKELGVE